MTREATPAPAALSAVRDWRPLMPALAGLTDRENEVLHWMTEGKGCQEIATILDLSHRTIEDYQHTIYECLDVETDLAACAAMHLADKADLTAQRDAAFAALEREQRRRRR